MDDDKKRQRDDEKVEHSEISDSGRRTIISKEKELEPSISAAESSGPKDVPLSFSHHGKIGRNHGTPQYRALRRAQRKANRARSAEAKAHQASTHESSDTVIRRQLSSAAPACTFLCLYLQF